MGRDFIFNPETIHHSPFVTILNACKNDWITLTNYNPHYVDKNETGLGQINSAKIKCAEKK